MTRRALIHCLYDAALAGLLTGVISYLMIYAVIIIDDNLESWLISGSILFAASYILDWIVENIVKP